MDAKLKKRLLKIMETANEVNTSCESITSLVAPSEVDLINLHVLLKSYEKTLSDYCSMVTQVSIFQAPKAYRKCQDLLGEIYFCKRTLRDLMAVLMDLEGHSSTYRRDRFIDFPRQTISMLTYSNLEITKTVNSIYQSFNSNEKARYS